MSCIDEFIPSLNTADTKKKLAVGASIITYLENPENSLECEDIGRFVDLIAAWLNSSHFKICQNGLDILKLVVDRMRDDYRPYLAKSFPAAVDRLGDQKEVVRVGAHSFIMRLLETDILSPQLLFERLAPSFAHKNSKVREELMICLKNVLNEYGSGTLSLSRLMPYLVKLLSDPQASVREVAVSTVVEIYRHVGEKMRADLVKKHNLPPAKVQVLEAKFDEVRDSGTMLAPATNGASSRRGDDETDRASVRSGTGSTSSASKRAISAPPVRRATAPQLAGKPGASGTGAAGSSTGGNVVRQALSRSGSMRKTPGSVAAAGGSGAIDAEQFIGSFENVPRVQIYSGRDVEDIATRIRGVIGDTSNDWMKRIESLKQLRALLIAGAHRYPDEFYPQLRMLEFPVQSSVRDLRSQVVREACVSIAYMAQELKQKFDHFAESVLPHLINLIPNSVKIMSTSGIVCIRFVIQNVHSPRLVPVLTMNLSHKSKEIRRAMCELLADLLHTWPTSTLERHCSTLVDAIRKGVSDADNEARVFARKAYWALANHFPGPADQMLNTLDTAYKRGIQSAQDPSAPGFSATSTLPSRHKSSIPAPSSTAVTPGITRTNVWTTSTYSERPPSSASAAASSYAGGSVENISRLPMPSTAGRRLAAQRVPSAASSYAGSEVVRTGIRESRTRSGLKPPKNVKPKIADGPTSLTPRHSNLRSTSTTDLQAAQRAKARQQYAEWSRMKSSLTPASSRMRKPSESGSTYGTSTADRMGRTRGRKPVSQSQPGSRSGSPSSRLNYITTNIGIGGPGDSATMGRLRAAARTPRIPCVARSAATSRETSPGPGPRTFRSRYMSGGEGTRSAYGYRQPVMAQKILQASREAETALESALLSSTPTTTPSYRPRRTSRHEYGGGGYEDGAPSDESETSSMCSDRSYESFARRTADLLSWVATHQSMYDELCSTDDGSGNANKEYDVPEILRLCSSSNWVDRKEGLIGLQGLLRSHRQLSATELRRVTEYFTKMFNDPHTKVFTLFLETVTELVTCYREDVIDWLYILLTRLLSKMGGDLLNSVVGKINRLLDLIRDSFPAEAQFTVLMRYMGDVTQTPNSKVKLATLTYLRRLLGQGQSQGTFGGGNEEALTAIRKLAAWSTDMKSLEVARASRATLCAMFNHSPSSFTLLMRLLTKREEETIQAILDSPRRASADSAGSASPSTLFPRSSPIGLTPLRQGPLSFSLSSPSAPKSREEVENVNPAGEDYYTSLQRTTDEIQSRLKSLTLGAGQAGSAQSSAPATSKDSGISQLSSGDDGRGLESPDRLLAQISDNGEGRFGGRKDFDGVDSGPHSITVLQSPGTGIGQPGFLSSRVREVIASLSDFNTRQIGLGHLSKILTRIQQERNQPRGISPEYADDERSLVLCFKQLLRMLLEAMKDPTADIRIHVFRVLEECVANPALTPHFEQYIELLLCRALDGYADQQKEVARAAEYLASTMGVKLSLDRVLNNINPLISTGDYPANQLAIKMMTKVAETHPGPAILTRLDDVMPSLIQAYDSEESSVRKAAVFCMVALHNSVGTDALKPYLSTLNGSKLKLLNLYIKRAQSPSQSQNSSSRTSPAGANF